MNFAMMPSPLLTNKRLFFLGAASLVLCVSFIMSIFAPFPLALAIVLYGRKKGYLVGSFALALSFILARFMYQDDTIFVFYLTVFLFAGGLSEIVLRQGPPVKGLVKLGTAFLTGVFLIFSISLYSVNMTPQKYIIQQIEKNADKIAEQKKLIEQSEKDNALEVLQLLDQPELLAQEVVEVFPTYLFMGVFIMLWFNMFLLLKSRRLLFLGFEFKYTEKELLNFKVPFKVVGLLVLGLIFALFGDKIGTGFEATGFTIIRCLGIFYFFQGFGIFIDLLDYLNLKGLFRSIIVMVVLFTTSYLIAAIGLFDNWFNFRNYLTKKN